MHYTRARRASATKPCKVPVCEGKVVTAGYCGPHYHRYLRHGDPLKGNARHGARKRWLEEHRDYDGEGCLIFPFPRVGNGYTTVTVDRRQMSGSRFMCELANGPPPEDWFQAAHSCGKGHEGCVHPKHLRWAKPIQNIGDKKAHGTQARGRELPVAKLTEADVLAIRRAAGRTSHRMLARRYGVSEGAIGHIVRRTAWDWLPEERIDAQEQLPLPLPRPAAQLRVGQRTIPDGTLIALAVAGRRRASGRTCEVPGCGNPHRSKGFCASHYSQYRITQQSRCSVEGCNRREKGRGMCTLHLGRLNRTGTTAPNPKAIEYGRVVGWMKDLVEGRILYGEDCLMWPFPFPEDGRPTVTWRGRPTTAARAVCSEIHGPPPARRYQAAHSCGRGDIGCVNPDHLRWALPKHNLMDKVAHGTHQRGTRHVASRLTDEQVIEIYRMRDTVPWTHLARKYGVGASTIRRIACGQSWGWLTQELAVNSP